MFRRNFLFLAILAAATVGPFAMFNDDLGGNLKKKWNDWTSAKKVTATDKKEIDLSPAGLTNETFNPVDANDAHPSKQIALHEVIRFDVDPRWVMDRWPRVTTTLADSELEGMRVLLVTGTEIDDMTGSLTYYFNKDHQVQRVTLHGHTGDERKLAALLTKHFGFRRQASLGAGLYLQRWNGKPTGVLHVTHAPVVRAGAPHSRLKVMLEINRPSAYYKISDAAKKLLENDKQARRW